MPVTALRIEADLRGSFGSMTAWEAAFIGYVELTDCNQPEAVIFVISDIAAATARE